jgi:beta-propeller repeat-containing protein/ASPM-SPD-2-Hydin domain-containing protein
VAAGADPKTIALKLDGADKLSLSEQGDLVAGINGNEFRFHKPYAYQLVHGKQAPVAVEYVLSGLNKATLHLGTYDKSRKLVIDPMLTYSTFLGGSQADTGNGLAIDSTGNAYIAGKSCSNDFVGGTNFKGGGTSDAFVTLINGATFPIASLSPATLNFGNQNVGATSTSQTATLRNTGTGILNISNISFAGATGDYSQTNNCGAQLTPAGGAKDNCTITITFAPTAGGSRPDIVQIADDSANSPQAVALSGTGVSVQGTIQLGPPTVAFGSQPIGTTSATKTVTLTNSSLTFPLTISSIATGNAAFKQTNNCPVSPATLAPTLTARFR